MKDENHFPTGTCDRCHRHTGVTILSKFNTDEVCVTCKTLETQHPDYQKASARELVEVQQGNYNFEGIGLPQGYEEWAKQQKGVIPPCPACNGERELSGTKGIFTCFFCGYQGA